MSEVKWIKLTVDMFDNRKIKYLRTLPEGNNIVLIWVMLLTMAGRCNSGGMIFLTENIPYTGQVLANELGFETSTVELALKILASLGMISEIDGYIQIEGWDDHQSADKLEQIREQNRIRKQKERERKQIAMSRDGHVTVTQCHATDIDKEIDIDKDNNNIISSKKYEIDYQEVINYYHHFCPSLPKVTKITEARKKLINARLKDYSIEEVKTAFKLAEESDFLTGRSGKWGGASFDWIMNTNNIVKILEGNYRNKEGAKTGVELYRKTKKGNYDFAALEYESKHRWESENGSTKR